MLVSSIFFVSYNVFKGFSPRVVESPDCVVKSEIEFSFSYRIVFFYNLSPN